MANNSIVQGLFGIDPMAYQQQQNAILNAQANEFAQLTPEQRATAGAYKGGSQLVGAGMGLLGVQDPQLVAQQTAQQLQGKFDLSTAEGLKAYGAALLQAGQQSNNPTLSNFGMMSLDKAQKMTAAGLENLKTQSEIAKNYQGNLPETVRLQQQINQLRRQGDPNGDIPALDARLRSLSKSEIPASVYNSVIAPATERYNVAIGNKESITPLINNIDSGILKFGLTDNFKNRLTTLAGESDAGSRAAAEFNSTLESIRLQAQILQKGNQTDRDAANIMNSFLSNVDKYDTKTVRSQLERINKLMDTQANNANALIKQTEDYYGGGKGQLTQGQPSAPTAPKAPTATPSTPTVAPIRAASGTQIYITPKRLAQVRASDPKYAKMTDEQLTAEIAKAY